MAIRSMTDVAFELMKKKKKPITFRKLWDEVSTIMGFSSSVAENKIAQFYANLTLDIRFVVVEENKWDLRSRRTFQEIHRDLSDLLDDADENEDEFNIDEEETLDEDGEVNPLVDSEEEEEY